ncbi:MarR family winged helix-turn-helix transcriptional regulator [Eggerthella sinensis]|uniref:MarR family winged helix-turn-helix transcriptional regulator n=1 Tax=Eggerthella sinensis TaxID=242230 RepID=UPI00266B62FC|nr:MarR family transcriptional regulator [Eggerthella sinensis]
MEYRALAQELVGMRAELRRAGVERLVDRMAAGEQGALFLLLQDGEIAHPKNLSERMGVSTARVATMLGHLEERGLLTRSPDPADNRQTVVALTDRGVAYITERRDEALGLIAQLLERLGPEDAAQYVRIQKKLVACLAEEAVDDAAKG